MYLKTANAEVRNYEMAPGNFEGDADTMTLEDFAQ